MQERMVVPRDTEVGASGTWEGRGQGKYGNRIRYNSVWATLRPIYSILHPSGAPVISLGLPWPEMGGLFCRETNQRDSGLRTAGEMRVGARQGSSESFRTEQWGPALSPCSSRNGRRVYALWDWRILLERNQLPWSLVFTTCLPYTKASWSARLLSGRSHTHSE